MNFKITDEEFLIYIKNLKTVRGLNMNKGFKERLEEYRNKNYPTFDGGIFSFVKFLQDGTELRKCKTCGEVLVKWEQKKYCSIKCQMKDRTVSKVGDIYTPPDFEFTIDNLSKLEEYIKNNKRLFGLHHKKDFVNLTKELFKTKYGEVFGDLNYMLYLIRNSIEKIPNCLACGNPIHALSSNKLPKYCNNTCKGLGQRTDNYTEVKKIVWSEMTDEEILDYIKKTEKFSGARHWDDLRSRLLSIFNSKNILKSPENYKTAELCHFLKRGLTDLPKCENCSSVNLKITPYNNTSNIKVYQRFCKECAKKTSSYESSIKEFLDRNKVEYVRNDRILLDGKELDFYIPSKKLAIEVNGLFWHSKKEKNYHLDKTLNCEARGIDLFQIFTDEIEVKEKIVLNRLKYRLGLTKYKIYARKCEIKEVSAKDRNKFLDKYHLQGGDKSSFSYGLYYRNRLVSVMTFCKPRIALGRKTVEESEFELSRFCNIGNFMVVGAASKLLNHFIKNVKPKKIYTYCDRRWSNGNFYENIGFKKIRNTEPNYYYVEPPHYLVRHHRFSFRKSLLSKKLEKYDPNLTEVQNMENNGYCRIFDCGNFYYEMDFSI